MEDILETCMVDAGLPVLDNKAFNMSYQPTQDLPYEPTCGNRYDDLLAEVKLSNFNMIHIRTSLDILVANSREMSQVMNKKRLLFVPDEIRVPVKFTNVNNNLNVPYESIPIPKLTINKKISTRSSYKDTKEKIVL